MTHGRRFSLLLWTACGLAIALQLLFPDDAWWFVAAQYTFNIGLLLGRHVAPFP